MTPEQCATIFSGYRIDECIDCGAVTKLGNLELVAAYCQQEAPKFVRQKMCGECCLALQERDSNGN